ncbi:unnamed protein product [Adineta ricciae]|uniref:Uncharacterized protein n=1 Tax=Adineta ricciae TaxID=249248 RepID=A0A815LIH2_ADIRI|nr:unnamed protein product [Adineta ricciae]CAF1410504.1 unnamed protein product [Adineta ricciae]
MTFKTIGRSHLGIKIRATGHRESSALVADSFASGRVFLAGDAADKGENVFMIIVDQAMEFGQLYSVLGVSNEFSSA